MRQPVMAKVFESEPMTMTFGLRSGHARDGIMAGLRRK